MRGQEKTHCTGILDITMMPLVNTTIGMCSIHFWIQLSYPFHNSGRSATCNILNIGHQSWRIHSLRQLYCNQYKAWLLQELSSFTSSILSSKEWDLKVGHIMMTQITETLITFQLQCHSDRISRYETFYINF